MTVEVMTFGCRLNSYESEVIKTHAQNAGMEKTIVVNTCAVTAEAVRQARQTIRRLKRENPDHQIIVTGCAAQTEPETFADMNEVSRVLGNQEKMEADSYTVDGLGTGVLKSSSVVSDAIVETSTAFGLENAEKVRVNDIMSVTETATHLIDGFHDRARAYVQIQNGCNHRCTFCIIPYGRGNSRSVAAGHIVDQIKRLVDKGFHEVVLTGVDLTSWGEDLPARPKLGRLVGQILDLVPDLSRLRLSSLDSIEVDGQLFELMTGHSRLMPHVHLSLQAGDDLILKRMKRRHLRGDSIDFVQKLKEKRPEIVIGGDIIAGFPTETEDMFQNTARLIEEVGMVWCHIFPYSPRKGTPAAKMPQVAKSVIKERAGRLREIGHNQMIRHFEGRLGQTDMALIEQDGFARLPDYTPVALPLGISYKSGDLVQVKLTGHTHQHMIGEAV